MFKIEGIEKIMKVVNKFDIKRFEFKQIRSYEII